MENFISTTTLGYRLVADLISFGFWFFIVPWVVHLARKRGIGKGWALLLAFFMWWPVALTVVLWQKRKDTNAVDVTLMKFCGWGFIILSVLCFLCGFLPYCGADAMSETDAEAYDSAFVAMLTTPLFLVCGVALVCHAKSESKKIRIEKRQEKDRRDKEEMGKLARMFNHGEYIVQDPVTDLTNEQKYAIVGLLVHAQGASERSAYSDEATQILMSAATSLGLSKEDIIRYMKDSMDNNAEQVANRMLALLDGIRDRNYLKDIFSKAIRIAVISGDADEIATLKHLEREMEL